MACVNVCQKKDSEKSKIGSFPSVKKFTLKKNLNSQSTWIHYKKTDHFSLQNYGTTPGHGEPLV